MEKKYRRNPNHRDALEELNYLTKRVGKLDDDGRKVPEIQELLDIPSQSKIEHHKKVYRLFKRAAENNASEQVMKMLYSSGIRFCNCAGVLLKLDDENFIKTLEYIANPVNINIGVLTRDQLTEFVRKVIAEKSYDVEEHKDTLHDQLKKTTARIFLHEKGIPTGTEITLAKKNKGGFPWDEQKGLRIDVAGFDENYVYGIEVKTNLQDFKSSFKTINEYSKYLDYMYILTSDLDVQKSAMEDLDEKIGVLYYDLQKNEISEKYSRLEAKLNQEVKNKKQNEIRYRIMVKELNNYMEDAMKVSTKHYDELL